jgi:enamidase
VQPLGILRMIAMLSALGEVPRNGVLLRHRQHGEQQADSGSSSRRAADRIMDRAQHTAGKDLLDSVRKGDIPGVSMVIIDGQVRVGRSRNTPPAETAAEVMG